MSRLNRETGGGSRQGHGELATETPAGHTSRVPWWRTRGRLLAALIGGGIVIVVVLVIVFVTVPTNQSRRYTVGLPGTVAGLPKVSSPVTGQWVDSFSNLTTDNSGAGKFDAPHGAAYMDQRDNVLLIVVVANSSGINLHRYWSVEQQGAAAEDHSLFSESAISPGPHGGKAWIARRKTGSGWVNELRWVTGTTFGAVIPYPPNALRISLPSETRMTSLLKPVRASVETAKK